ncbi:glycosyltransferase [Auraticoccus sp. F435]|uniref:Glycosyltransferase n=1 Tax=Auraticoccus cholistanensis TaxID=2656650 RepID=A0A6A9UTH5_9ACTN|nr:glycosyltransferase [Auraticoccus cholistanensis]MVA74884.1 glycosyltransferase [Auraticoccus cholistanensis]
MTTETPQAPVPLAQRVTVVLLTYNCAHRLDEVLDHLLALGVPLVAVDNASGDGTVDVLRRRGVEVHRLPRNIGAAARNVGVELARTPYVACCDDDGWYEREGLVLAADLMDRHPVLAVVNARILVGPEQRLDPISAVMADSPLPDRHDLPGTVLMGFMAGAVVVRRSAYLQVGGYAERFFIGGEEETLALPLLRAGWQMRYVPEVVVQHRPSRANVDAVRPYGMRNTLWNAWLHRPLGSALRWTWFVLRDPRRRPGRWRGVLWALLGMPAVLRDRSVMPAQLDADLRVLDEAHYATLRRPQRAEAAQRV